MLTQKEYLVTSRTSEKGLLAAYLRSSREHIVGSISGLSDDDLRHPMLPSAWTPIGLVQHLAVDVERFWFGAVVAGDEAIIRSFDDAPDAWKVTADTRADDVFELYRAETEQAEQILSGRCASRASAKLFCTFW
jgi:hypothetical protein